MLNKECIISIDQGTTGSRIHIFDSRGNVIVSEYREFKQHFPEPAWVEHDAEEIWSDVNELLQKALKKCGRKPSHIQGLGITNQRETAVIWERKTGKPIYNAIVWQCRRSAARCAELKAQGHEETLHKKTGLLADAYFSATKFEWLLDNVEGAREAAEKGDLAAGTIDSWLIFKLTGEHFTDYTNASRTLLYNIEKKDWDDELLQLFNIPRAILPQVRPSRFQFGSIINVEGLDGVPVLAAIGDQQAALFGQLCVNAGQAKNTYGTGAFLLLHTGNQLVHSDSGILTTLACNHDGQVAYALEGAIFVAGAVVQWLRDSLRLFDNAASSEDLLKSLEDKEDEIVFVPAFTGLGAPHWDMQARGAILGLSRDTSAAQITRAALKSIALQSYDLISIMEKNMKEKMELLRVDGGASANTFLMQYQADIIAKPVERPSNTETTALGSAYLAGMEAGLWTFDDLQSFQSKKKKRFEPNMNEKRRRHELTYWHQGLERAKLWNHG